VRAVRVDQGLEGVGLGDHGWVFRRVRRPGRGGGKAQYHEQGESHGEPSEKGGPFAIASGSVTAPASPGPDVAAEKVVTAARPITSTASVPQVPETDEHIAVDFAPVKRQLTMAQVVDHLGLKLRGSGPQRRCACPIHRGDCRGRTFSVNLEHNVFHCFQATCAAKGDVIDLWAGVNGLSLREATLDLVRTFDLEPAPSGTGKRNG